MKLIKIIRDSIKKNPNAGRTEIHEPINREISFRLEGVMELPGYIEDKDYYKKEWGAEVVGDPSTYFIEGGLINRELAEPVSQIPGIKMKMTQDIRTNRFMTPEPAYRFSYEDTKIECLNCHNQILQSEIIDDEVVTEDDDYPVEICPVCRAVDEFEKIEYEKIEDVVKEMQL